MYDPNHVVVEFPGLGIAQSELSKIAFAIGNAVEVRWYGIFITLGIVFAFLYAMYRGKRNEGVIADDVIDVGIFLVIFGIVGARAYYVLTTLDSGNYKSFLDVIAIWKGGIAIYGAVIGGALAILVTTKIKKMKTLQFFDMVVPGLILAQAIGRWGNFFNGEAHGAIITEITRLDLFGFEILLPSGEGTIFHALRMHLNGTEGWNYYHPTFLYESVWNLVGFVILTLFYRHKKFHGQLFLMYCTWYGLGRTFIEGFRTDSLYIPGTTLRISQCVGAACFIVGGILLIALSIRFRHRDPIAPTKKALAAEDTQGEGAIPVSKASATAWGRVMENLLKKKKAEADTPSENEETTETETTEKENNDGNEN